jgi:hypothetical protein
MTLSFWSPAAILQSTTGIYGISIYRRILKFYNSAMQLLSGKFETVIYRKFKMLSMQEMKHFGVKYQNEDEKEDTILFHLFSDH